MKRISEQLALFGGSKTINKSFKKFNSIDGKEIRAVKKVMKSGVLSKFLGTSHEDFYGGPKILEFEKVCTEYFEVKHAITVNSWTSGLISAIGAIGIEPGDEVILPPWTMSASAMAILHWGGIPVFADIDPRTFCLSPEETERKITTRTKAIMPVDIFGQSSDLSAFMKLAETHNLKVISDTAQAPGATFKNRKAGTLAHIGGISLNYHKHIHTGEGGVLFTNDDELAMRMKLIRNHGESVIGGLNYRNLENIVGYNFRMGEIEAAIGIEQLKKLDSIVSKKQKTGNMLTRELTGLRGLSLPQISTNLSHVYYVYPLVLDINIIEIPRSKIVEALRSEGVPNLVEGYVNLHLLPIFQAKIAFGKSGFPWSLHSTMPETNYSKGICPIAEQLQDSTFMALSINGIELNENDIKLIGNAFRKVWKNLGLLL